MTLIIISSIVIMTRLIVEDEAGAEVAPSVPGRMRDRRVMFVVRREPIPGVRPPVFRSSSLESIRSSERAGVSF